MCQSYTVCLEDLFGICKKRTGSEKGLKWYSLNALWFFYSEAVKTQFFPQRYNVQFLNRRAIRAWAHFKKAGGQSQI